MAIGPNRMLAAIWLSGMLAGCDPGRAERAALRTRIETLEKQRVEDTKEAERKRTALEKRIAELELAQAQLQGKDAKGRAAATAATDQLRNDLELQRRVRFLNQQNGDDLIEPPLSE